MKNVKSPGNEAGFSLVETIAAMGILALAAIPLLELVNNSIRGSADLEKRFLARTVAENLLVQEIVEVATPIEKISVETGTTQQLGRKFSWIITTSPVAEAEPQLVVVEVRYNDTPRLLAQMTGVKLPAISLPENLVDSESSTQDDDR